jgi:hypothetical protein
MTLAIQVATLLLATSAAVGLGLVWRVEFRASYEVQVEVSRFALFKVRDKLIRLAAEGTVSESEPAWKASYDLVTMALDPQGRLPPLEFMKARWRNRRRDATAPRVSDFGRQQADLAARCSAYADVVQDLHKAVQTMVVKQMRFRDLVAIYVVLPIGLYVADKALGGTLGVLQRIIRNEETISDIGAFLGSAGRPRRA